MRRWFVRVKMGWQKKLIPKKTPQFSMIRWNDLEIEICKKSIKNLILRINNQGAIKVSAPFHCSMETIRNFITQRQDWITTTQEKVASKLTAVALTLETGAPCSHLGINYLFRIEETIEKPKITLADNHICCFVKPNTTLIEKQQLFQKWQREQLKSLLPALIEKWEPILGVKVNQWGIRAMKTRWGSCNPVKKHISLNLTLIQKPLVCLEYVLVHELVHLLEASHNKRFHALMTHYLPDWKKYKVLLNGAY
ncbi:MAG: M48 family metallopeptidase [Silvanigrellaceae bacterium]|nr:M48 family metallopeptidase [Silvanigrellaceae bacterium]